MNSAPAPQRNTRKRADGFVAKVADRRDEARDGDDQRKCPVEDRDDEYGDDHDDDDDDED